MTKIKKYVAWGFVGSIIVFAWALAWAIGPKTLLVASFCVITFAILHHLLNFRDSRVGGDDVTPQGGNAE